MQKRYAVLLGFLTLAILIFLNPNFPPVKFIAGLAQNIFLLPKQALYSLKTNILPDDSAAVKKLKEENAILAKKAVDYNKLKQDNEVLRSQFESGSTLTYKMLQANVIGFIGNFSSPFEVIIDRGEKDNVRENAAVILGQNLVGKVSSVSESYSKVALPTSNSFRALGKTTENQALGVVSGKEDFTLFDRVSINDRLLPGETVITVGEIDAQGSGIPPDLVIGKIQTVARSESSPFQNAKLASPLNFQKIALVFVILSLK